MVEKIDVFLAQRFTHMLPGDIALWQRFLVKHGEYYERFEYDRHVGQGVPIDPAWPPEIARAALALTQKRIDAVGFHGDETWIFEVKPDAGLGAVGQLVSYKALWIRDFGAPAKLYLAIVTDRLNPDEQYLFSTYDIRIFIVTP